MDYGKCSVCGVERNHWTAQGTKAMGAICTDCNNGPRICWSCCEKKEIGLSCANCELCFDCWQISNGYEMGLYWGTYWVVNPYDR